MEQIKEIGKAKEFLYRFNSNYIEESISSTGRKCIIFFSSNGLYEETDFKVFQKRMLHDDRYEWKSIAKSLKYHKDLGKIIYIRDVYKYFYINGINSEINTIDKLLELVKSLSMGYQVTTVGISSGGYLAVISGLFLKAEKIFNFSGQYSLKGQLKSEDYEKYSHMPDKAKYLNILNIIKDNSNVPIYYFCPIGCNHDYENYKLVEKEENVHCFLFPDKIHAATVYPFNFPDIIYLNKARLNKLEKKYNGRVINKKVFFFQTVTVRGLINIMLDTLRGRFSIKFLKKKWDV